MLTDSMRFAKEDIVERLRREAVADAHRSIEEVRSALHYDGALVNETERTAIHHQIHVLEKAIDSGDRDGIDLAAEKLHQVTHPFAQKRMDRAIQSALKGAHIDDVAS